MTTAPEKSEGSFDADRAEREFYEYLLESYDINPEMFKKEDLGWKKLGDDDLDGEVVGRGVLVREARRARVMSVADPLIRRAVSLGAAYVLGQGVTIEAAQEEDTEQDVDQVLTTFMDDPGNQAVFSSDAARTEIDRVLRTDGNLFHALVTDPRTGRVQIRRIPFRQISDILTDPEDADSPWFYIREWTTMVLETGYNGVTTRTRRETRRVLYPDVNFRPNQRPKTIDGIPVEWNSPVVHTRVNRQDGSRWGCPDLLAALPWAEGYKGFLEDWARYMKAISRIAFKATSKGRNARLVRDRINSQPDIVGATAVIGPDQNIEAVSKSGATLDSESGRPLAAMVAAATDTPVTMLLGDPGVTGARATAETLDQPMQLSVRARQTVHAQLYRTVLSYVVVQAIKAPNGVLNGEVRIDPASGRENVTLVNGQTIVIRVDWPSVEKVPMETLIKAIVDADGTGLLPELTIAKLLLIALDVDEPEEVLARLTGENGEFLDPRAGTTDQAGQAAAEAHRRGEDAAEYV